MPLWFKFCGVIGFVAEYIHGTNESEQDRLAKLNRLTNEPFLEFLAGGGAQRILEVGSGLGILAQDCSLRFPRARVFGIEFSAAQLARTPRADRLHFVRADAHKIPLAENSFDVVYCRYVLEHVAHPVDVLKEMRRVLNKGGRAYAQENNILMSVFDPECPRFESVWQKFAVLQKDLGGDALIGKKLFRYFKQAGFEDIQLSYQPEIHFSGTPGFRPWLENLIGNVRSGEEALKERGLATHEEIIVAIDELSALMTRDDASALFYWNRASGRK